MKGEEGRYRADKEDEGLRRKMKGGEGRLKVEKED